MIRSGAILFLAAWLALGVGRKISRYAPAGEAAGPRAERLVRKFLAGRGWVFSGARPITGAGLYSAQSFAKPGCARNLEVAVLGASDEAVDVVFASLGPNAAFPNNGALSPRPSSLAFFAAAARLGPRFASDRTMPPLVVSPAPRADDHSSCAPPAPVEWARIGSE